MKSSHPKDIKVLSLLKSVLVQAIKDCVGTEEQRAEVIHWLVSPDFQRIVGPLGYEPNDMRLKIANILTQKGSAMAVHYCNKLLEEII